MKPKYHDIKIKGIDTEFRGFFDVNKRRVFVTGATPKDRHDVEITATSQHHPVAYGEIARVRERGDNFRAPQCPHAAPIRGQCGGCPAMHLNQNLRDELRFDATRQSLDHLGTDVTWQAAPEQTGYRNRSNFVAHLRRGRVVLGSFAPRSRNVAEMTGCLVVRPAIAAVHGKLEDLLTEAEIPIGDDDWSLRWVSIREANDEVVVELIVRDEKCNWIDDVSAKIMDLDGVKGVGISVNAEKTNAIRIAPTKMIDGEGTLVQRYGSVDLEISPGSFAQLNVAVASRMYERVREWSTDAEVVWDLYCGIGGLGLNAVVGCDGTELWGVDDVDSAVEAAQKNADRAGVKANFQTIDLAKADTLEALAEPDLVLVNPPRKGLSAPLRKILCGLEKTPQLIYMSCNADSFSRDAEALSADGQWKLECVEVHDMLPMTGHVELLGRFVAK